jgi:hypothetical protein
MRTPWPGFFTAGLEQPFQIATMQRAELAIAGPLDRNFDFFR